MDVMRIIGTYDINYAMLGDKSVMLDGGTFKKFRVSGFESGEGDTFLYGIGLSTVRHSGLIEKYAKTTIARFLGYRPNHTNAKCIPEEITAFIKSLRKPAETFGKSGFRDRYLLRSPGNGEIALYDLFTIRSNLIWGSDVSYFVKVDQENNPSLETTKCIESHENPYILLNGKYMYRKDFSGLRPWVRDLLKYNGSGCESELISTFDAVLQLADANKKEVDEILQQSVDSFGMSWREGYEDKSETLKYWGFGIRSAELINEENTSRVDDLCELYEDIVRCFAIQNDQEYTYCGTCNSVHDSHYDRLARKISLVNTMDSNGEIVVDEGKHICESDAVLMLSVCEKCGTVFWARGDGMDDKHTCSECYKEVLKYKIRRYHNTPTMKYYDYDDEKGENFVDEGATPELWGGYGIELEVGNGGEKDSESEQVIKLLNEEAYTMHDGSIFRDVDYDGGDEYECGGFEIITYPHTGKALLNMNWEKTFKHLLKHNYRSHDIGSCGLHIHISRTLFENDDAIKKMMYFYEVNYGDVCNFARRTKSSAGKWASPYVGQSFIETMPPQKIKQEVDYAFSAYNKSRSHDLRYKCVNIVNTNTIEVRIIRGTLNMATFFASLDFLIKIAKKSNEISWDDVLTNNIEKWFENFDDSTFEYMKSRGCFNQPKQYAFPVNPEGKEASGLYDVADCVQASEQQREEIARQGLSFAPPIFETRFEEMNDFLRSRGYSGLNVADLGITAAYIDDLVNDEQPF